MSSKKHEQMKWVQGEIEEKVHSFFDKGVEIESGLFC